MNIKVLNSKHLKIISYLTMLIDHIGAVIILALLNRGSWANLGLSYDGLVDIYYIFRYIGRIAFPIFAFSIVEGYIKTSNIKKYFVRLIILALISEIPFDLAFYNTYFYLQYQNVIITLLLGLAALYFGGLNENYFYKIIVALACMGLAELFKSDYGWYGVLLICLYYYLKDLGEIKYLIWAPLIYYNAPYAVISLIFIYLYNGQKGMGNTKWFYLFYPVHLGLLYIVSQVLIGKIPS